MSRHGLESQYITRCPGLGDDVTVFTSDYMGAAGPDFSGQAWTRDIDPASPGTLAGSASFTEAGPGWVTIDVTWTLSRP